ncbi:unnamed protein product [Arctogadus glacialis]
MFLCVSFCCLKYVVCLCVCVCVCVCVLEEAFLAKVTKYQLLRNEIAQLGYTCKLLVFIFGSLGHVHRLVIRGLQMAGIPKPKAKALAKFCSISVLIGSRHIWRRRCFLYP